MPVFVTKDTSLIRELLAPRCAPDAIAAQSLAEATIPAGAATQPHYHPITEEIYYILSGSGLMRFPDCEHRVVPGDAIAIPPGTPHQLINKGEGELVLLCCCSPAYSDEDTVLVEPW
ncbi:MAG: cupin domain-containing protein [Armatimonas sp.]